MIADASRGDAGSGVGSGTGSGSGSGTGSGPGPACGDRARVIPWAEMERALRTTGAVPLEDKEVSVRDCFDALFENLELLENNVRSGLLDFHDLEFVLEYWIGKIREREVVMTQIHPRIWL